MAKINRLDVIKKLIDGLGLEISREKIATEVADKVIPTFDLTPDKNIRVMNENLSDGTSLVIFTTSTHRRTFITSCTLTVSKDVNNASINSRVSGIIESIGADSTLLRIRYEPLTAGNHMHTINFNPPLEMQKGADLNLINSNGTASIDSSATISFYELE